MGKLTIVDIANMAGVGTTTVTRYFNGVKIKEENRIKIKAIVEKYNYKPNTFAKALKSSDSKIIGIIVPTLNSFITGNTLQILNKLLKENGYEILILNTNFDDKAPLEYIHRLERMNVSGIIFIATTMNNEYEDIFSKIIIPIVVIGQESKNAISMIYDDYNAGSTVANYTIENGHKDIVYLGVNENDISVGIKRKKGIIDKLALNNIVPKYLETDFSLNKSLEILKVNFENIKNSTCIICATDRIAYACIEVFKEHNKIAGKDYSIIGFGDYDSSRLLSYPLSTISFDIESMSNETVNILLKNIKNSTDKIEKKKIGFKLIKRNSVLNLKL